MTQHGCNSGHFMVYCSVAFNRKPLGSNRQYLGRDRKVSPTTIKSTFSFSYFSKDKTFQFKKLKVEKYFSFVAEATTWERKS